MMSIILFFLAALFFVFLAYGIYKDVKGRRRVEDLLQEIADVNERLRIMDQQKTEFISIASHQLRTPLTLIKGYASMVIEGTFGQINDDVRKAVQALYASSEKIVELINELLTVSRLEEGRTALSFTTVNFVEFVQKVLDHIKEKIQAVGLELSFTIEDETKEVLVELDEKKLTSVILHIFDNAINFTSPPGAIRVAVTADDIAKKICLAISDTGIGMTTEQITALFERFDLKVSVAGEIMARGVQKNKEAKDEKGSQSSVPATSGRVSSGIDIYVAKEIIHAHHGHFMAESGGVNMGTTFIIELPMAGKSITV